MIRHTSLLLLLPLVVPASGCASSGVSRVRFANEAPVWKVDDRHHIDKPRRRGFPKTLYYFDRFFFRRSTRLMEVPEPRRAANVNALDEVPDSTWFVNRIHRHPLTPAQVGRGPNVDDGPSLDGPWKITSSKTGGSVPGFVIEDSRGVKYILKFDEKGIPEIETAADIVVQRLLWAAGFNVPEDSVVLFERDRLVIADGATVKEALGNKRPMNRRDVDAKLALANVAPDGRYRGVASKYLRGVPVGGAAPEGTRDDDANDVVPHEERRDLRGQFVPFSWVDHTDVKSDNMLDMWVEDSGDPETRYLIHYLVDFGKGLGGMGWINRRPEDGFAYAIDFEYIFYSTFTAGLWKRPWEGADGPALLGVGRFDAEHFDPASWRPQYPWEPFARRDRFDGYWGAKIVAAFSRAHIRAAVDAGKYSDPRAADYITETLVRRRRKILRYWFRQVTPLDYFVLRDGALCFDDLALLHRVRWASPDDHYAAAAYDYEGRSLDWSVRATPGSGSAAAPTPTACIPAIPAGATHDGYTIVELRAHRADFVQPPVEVHLARGPDGEARIIGVYRR